jgi:hypothetical protein
MKIIRVPEFTNVKNEIVFYLGVLLTIIMAVLEVIEGWEVDSIASWSVLIPAVWGAIQSNFAYGPQTVKAIKGS